MAKSVNKALLLGYVGKAPEIRSTASGTVAASFSLATTERQEDRQGKWSEKTEWHNLVAFGRTAEIVRDYVSKGAQLFVQGKIQTRTWDDRESGEKKYRTEIVVFDLTLLGGSNRSDGRRESKPTGKSAFEGCETDSQFSDEAIDPSEIPF